MYNKLPRDFLKAPTAILSFHKSAKILSLPYEPSMGLTWQGLREPFLHDSCRRLALGSSLHRLFFDNGTTFSECGSVFQVWASQNTKTKKSLVLLKACTQKNGYSVTQSGRRPVICFPPGLCSATVLRPFLSPSLGWKKKTHTHWHFLHFQLPRRAPLAHYQLTALLWLHLVPSSSMYPPLKTFSLPPLLVT